jgi:hypothetical protein
VRKRFLFLAALSVALNAMAADGLRTLFHTADERRELDRERRGEPPEAAPDARRAPNVVNGFVKRSDGRDTVWLDGRTVTGPEAHKLADPAKVREGARNDRPSIEIHTTR